MIRIFLVDDHTIVRDGLRAVLEGHPEITVVGDFSSGRQAASQVKALQPDVVIMDIWMPEENGFDATRRILEIDPAVKVIFLSMLGTPEHVYRALQAGASGYLLKESAGREVVVAVLAVAAGTQYFSQTIAGMLVTNYINVHNPQAEKSPLERLSQREREVLQLVVEGKSSAEVGQLLHLSTKTVETYRSRMMHKLGVSDMPSLIKLAIQMGLIPLT
jgi:DNA-binding NarL/FixJ family response regulator